MGLFSMFLVQAAATVAAATPEATPSLAPWVPLAPTGLAGVIFWFYQSHHRDALKKYEEIALDYRQVIQENTAVITKLIERLGGYNA